MKANLRTLIKLAALEESGQILPWVAMLVVFIVCGIGALTIDVGRGVIAQHLLQSSADAAALAGAQALGASVAPLQSDVMSQACKFGGQVSGGNCTVQGLNANPGLIPNATMSSGYPSLYCSTTVTDDGTGCVGVTTPSGGSVNANTVQVAESITLPTWFGAVIGVPTLHLTAGSMAAMKGSSAPYNVAIIIDTTGSMNSTDGKTSNCSGSRISCGLNGALTLLGTLSPCASGSPCGSVVSGTTNVPNPVDEVAIYTFPGLVSSSDTTGDANCSQQMIGAGQRNATISYYNTTTPPVYEITPYSSNYATSDPTKTNKGATDTNLSTNSLLVDATGGKNGCNGLQAVGGAGTYYAQVITQAQADLVNEYNARYAKGQVTQNVMIILSDGDATSTYDQLGNYNTSLTAPYYQSIFNECEQAVAAAQAATHAGTTVYTVAYGTQSSGCASDQSGFSVTINGTKYKNTSPSNLSPCTAMQQMASSPSTFYSDYVAGGNGGSDDPNCTGASGSDTDLGDIFTDIGNNLSSPRLLPWGTS